MKLLRTPKMRSLFAEGKRIAKKRRAPGDGTLVGLLNRDDSQGWHYQVDWIHDTRWNPRPYITVFAFSPKSHGTADYYLDAKGLARP